MFIQKALERHHLFKTIAVSTINDAVMYETKRDRYVYDTSDEAGRNKDD